MDPTLSLVTIFMNKKTFELENLIFGGMCISFRGQIAEGV